MEKALAATTVMLRIAAPVAAISGVAWMALVLINMTSDIHSVFDPENWRLYFFETPVGRCPSSVSRSLRSPSYWLSCLGTAGCGIPLCFTLVLCC